MPDERIIKFIEERKDDMLRDIAELVAIDSVAGEAAEGAPYGVKPREALTKTAEILKRLGFESEIPGDRILTVTYGPAPVKLAMLSHVDVVPAGDGWTVTEPFKMVEKDGYIYGRGVADDKGPAVAAIYALAAVKELGLPLSNGVQIVIGSCEERDMDDVSWYYERFPAPPMVFSPDSNYPIINTEKGRLLLGISAKYEQTGTAKIISVKGGTVVNAVPAEAEAVICGVSADDVCRASDEIGLDGIEFKIESAENAVKITAYGMAAHAAYSDCGKNAVVALLSLLSHLPYTGGAWDSMRAVAEAMPFGDVWGETCGADCRDDIAGRTTMSLDIITADEKGFEIKIDCRTSLQADAEKMCKALDGKLGAAADAEIIDFVEPHHVPADSELVSQLLSIYTEYTGREGAPGATGGLTYVHHIEGGVAFGCEFPGEETHIHEPDECIAVKDLAVSAEMFADAISRLCK